jgi:DNA helicase-2/ATP-dependent DNA helicase PcrA
MRTRKNMPLEFVNELNPEQCKAVTTIDGPLLIIAGAGSGKTRVITFRIAHMLEKGIPQSAILALTFTNKAAREMALRVKQLTGKKLPHLTVSTFHAFGVQVLRNEIQRLGWRDNFSIYDEVDRNQLIKETARDEGFSADSIDLYEVGQLFSNIKVGRLKWEHANDQYERLYNEYNRSLKAYNAVDFDDLIVLPIRIFEEFPEALASYRLRYKYLMVDEFQDTSYVQYRMMKFLADRNVCVVGDDDQSIYSWRGANYENIITYERDFPGVVEIKLEQNYRSTSTILEAANGVISNNTNRKEKALWSGESEGKPIELCFPENEVHEAEFIANTIRKLKISDSVKLSEFGVLIRTNSLTRHIEEAFLADNLPYRVSGGTSFFQRKEIKDIISYLRVISNPDDDVNLLRIINTPRRGIGRKSVEDLSRIATEKDCSLFHAITAARYGDEPGIGEREKADLGEFQNLIEQHRSEMLGKKAIAPKVRALVDQIDYWGYLVSENQKSDKAARWKFLNVESFINSIDAWEKDPDNLDPGLYNYLNRITLITRDDLEEEDEGKINLMTIHAAKGLEFDVVFIAGCEDGIIPHAKSLEEGEGNIEEERRLFYVAITRAKKKLILTSARSRRKMNSVTESQPCPFIAEIPEHLLQVVEPEEPLKEEEIADAFARMKARFKVPV